MNVEMQVRRWAVEQALRQVHYGDAGDVMARARQYADFVLEHEAKPAPAAGALTPYGELVGAVQDLLEHIGSDRGSIVDGAVAESLKLLEAAQDGPPGYLEHRATEFLRAVKASRYAHPVEAIFHMDRMMRALRLSPADLAPAADAAPPPPPRVLDAARDLLRSVERDSPMSPVTALRQLRRAMEQAA